MTLIGLLRHGEVEGGACFRGSTDDPLTDTGLDQMQAATEGGPGGVQGWDRVITSPLERCAGFAREFSQQHSLPLTFDDRFKEIHFGDWEGRTAAELMVETPDVLTRFWSDPDKYPPPGGESLLRFQARVLDAWNATIHHHTGQRILLVTHGGVIRILHCHVQQRPVSELLEIEVKHGALYTLHVSVDTNETTTSQLIVQV